MDSIENVFGICVSHLSKMEQTTNFVCITIIQFKFSKVKKLMGCNLHCIFKYKEILRNLT